MKIGIDGRSLTQRKAGVGYYLSEIISRWSHSCPNDNLQIFSNQAIDYPLKRGIEHHVNYNTFGLPWYVFRSHKNIIQQEPNIFWGAQNLLPRYLPKNFPAAITIHDCVHLQSLKYSPSLIHNLIHRYYFPKSIQRSFKIMAVSNFVADEIQKYFDIPHSSIEVIPLGVNPIFLKDGINSQKVSDTRKRYGLDSPYILSVGTLEPRKNLSILLHAFSLLPPSLQNKYQLVFAGKKGWRQRKFTKYLKSYEAKSQVKILGYVPRQDLAHIYSAAQVLVFPSRYEGFGLPLLEAMSAGCPVIACRTAAVQEVASTAAILLSPLSSAEDWSKSLSQVLESSSLKENLRMSGYDQAQKFSWDNCVRKTTEVLHSIGQ